MNSTPRSNRLHIALFGRRNTGKSSLINALTGQEIAVVSDVPGTTTDPVYKSMEVVPLGPVIFIDTPGIDDEGMLGRLRVEKTREVLRKTDIAVLVITEEGGWGNREEWLAGQFKQQRIPFVMVVNKSDISKNCDFLKGISVIEGIPVVKMSAKTGKGVEDLIRRLIDLKKEDHASLHLVDGLVEPGDLVILVTPIDSGAPKGRIILPQQQVLRDILDKGAAGLMVRETQLKHVLDKLTRPPDVVITDSQIFDKVKTLLPPHIPLTSFSIIYARNKGHLGLFYRAVKQIQGLKDGDNILVAEGCTHHRKEDDIGTVKIPALLRKKTGKKLNFHHVSGGFFKEDLSPYSMIIHCGGCMLNKREMEYRQFFSEHRGVPMINYGIILAYLHGMLDRALEPFKDELNQ
ncbi:MAG TPA: [FeFe] hydrogenase H-cluster maturation GTPase HydF [Clostridiales bacterium]|nr:[FeFe] hydrogenase H-cluster maturation GTPase HydF [Clostridiales bacterium]